MHNVIVSIPNVPEEDQRGKYMVKSINFKRKAIPLLQKTEVDETMYNYLTEKIPTPKIHTKSDGTMDVVDVMVPRFNVIEV